MTAHVGTDVDFLDPVHGSSEPNLFWTTANIGEAAPAVMTPLCWSLWGPGNELAVRETWHRFGMLGPEEIYVDPDQSNRLTGVFFGRQALNMAEIRRYVDRFPGISADDFELGLAGALHADPAPFVRLTPRQQRGVAAVVDAVRRTHSTRLHQMAVDQQRWWRREVLSRTEPGNPKARLDEAFDRFVRSIGIHNETRLLVVAAMSSIHRIAASVDRLDLVPAVTAAFGDVAELSMGNDLWEVASGILPLGTFIQRHGFHGENEGNPAGRSWRENPRLLDPTLAALRVRDSYQHPRQRASAAVARQQQAVHELKELISADDRTELATALTEAATAVRETEVGKGAFLTAVDGFRCAARDLGAQLADLGRIADSEDVFFLTLDEFRDDAGGPLRDRIAFRRERWTAHRSCHIPHTFRGMPEPIAQATDRVKVGDVITGIGASAAVHQGRVRVVHRTDDEDALEPGDVLVCEATDPSWTPLFLLADAVVVDIGSVGSHGAIIARELGLPAVINTGDGSRRLRDGDQVIVDGNSGTVTVVAVHEPWCSQGK